MSVRPSPVTSAASMSSQPSCWTGYVAAAARPRAGVGEDRDRVGPPPDPGDLRPAGLVERADRDVVAVEARDEDRRAERAVGGLREQLDAEPGQAHHDVGPPVAVHVADGDGLRPLSVGSRGRVGDRRVERAVRLAREYEQLEVGRSVGVARGQDDVGDAVARDVTDGDGLGLRSHRGDLVRPELAARGDDARRHDRQQRQQHGGRDREHRDSCHQARTVTLSSHPHSRLPVPPGPAGTLRARSTARKPHFGPAVPARTWRALCYVSTAGR